MNIEYIDEAGDIIKYKWWRNPIKWYIAKRAWRKLSKRVKIGGPIEFTGANEIITHEVEL